MMWSEWRTPATKPRVGTLIQLETSCAGCSGCRARYEGIYPGETNFSESIGTVYTLVMGASKMPCVGVLNHWREQLPPKQQTKIEHKESIDDLVE